MHSLFGVFGTVDETVHVAVLNEWHVSFSEWENAVFALLITTLHFLLKTWRSSPPLAIDNPLNVDMTKIVERKVSEILSLPIVQHITLGEVDVRLLMKSRDLLAAHIIWKLTYVLIEGSVAEANNAVLSLAESERPPIPTCHPSKLTPPHHAVFEE
ncbi:hypothetical protein BLNAU_5654 [Blattamonas nauphoetae]|uniref:Uncharacterized protein n=1 Tax=Blattamonas nauphoetae TaxID=2049346 RepID=A0ABQ9Y6M3_9EUKA|nr:hypothetical protein BLNAU_5654 [Blattamonas nauphoetae]